MDHGANGPCVVRPVAQGSNHAVVCVMIQNQTQLVSHVQDQAVQHKSATRTTAQARTHSQDYTLLNYPQTYTVKAQLQSGLLTKACQCILMQMQMFHLIQIQSRMQMQCFRNACKCFGVAFKCNCFGYIFANALELISNVLALY